MRFFRFKFLSPLKAKCYYFYMAIETQPLRSPENSTAGGGTAEPNLSQPKTVEDFFEQLSANEREALTEEEQQQLAEIRFRKTERQERKAEREKKIAELKLKIEDLEKRYAEELLKSGLAPEEIEEKIHPEPVITLPKNPLLSTEPEKEKKTPFFKKVGNVLKKPLNWFGAATIVGGSILLSPAEGNTAQKETVIEKTHAHKEFVPDKKTVSFLEEEQKIKKEETIPDPAFYKSLPEAGKQYYEYLTAPERKGHSFFLGDKSKAVVHLVNSEGKLVKSFPVIFGREKGEHSNDTDFGKNEKEHPTTPSYMYHLNGDLVSMQEEGEYGRGNVYLLMGTESSIAFHIINERLSSRLPALETPTPDDNRQSWGCVNTTKENMDEIRKYIEEGMPFVVLPENPNQKIQLPAQFL